MINKQKLYLHLLPAGVQLLLSNKIENCKRAVHYVRTPQGRKIVEDYIKQLEDPNYVPQQAQSEVSINEITKDNAIIESISFDDVPEPSSNSSEETVAEPEVIEEIPELVEEPTVEEPTVEEPTVEETPVVEEQVVEEVEKPKKKSKKK